MLRSIRFAAQKFSSLNTAQLTAALSFHVFFAVTPLLFMALAVFGMVLGSTQVQATLLDFLRGYTSAPIVEFVSSMLSVVADKNVGILALIVGVVTMLLGLMGVTGSIMEMFEEVWQHEEGEETLLSQVKRSAIAALVLGVMGVVLIGSMLLKGVFEVAIIYAAGFVTPLAFLVTSLNTVIAWVLTFVGLTLLFKLVPKKRVRWKYVLLPAALTATLLYGLKYGFELYVAFAGLASAYGAASSLFLFLIWLQLVSTVLLFGICMCQAQRRIHYTRR